MRRVPGSDAVAWAVFQHPQVQITLLSTHNLPGIIRKLWGDYLFCICWWPISGESCMQVACRYSGPLLTRLLFLNYAFKSGKRGLQIYSPSCKFTCHQQLKKREKERKGNGKLTFQKQYLTCLIIHPLLVFWNHTKNLFRWILWMGVQLAMTIDRSLWL